MLASLVWLIALCTRGWVELILPEPGVYLPSLRNEDRGKMVLVEKIWTGMWNFCRVEYTNATSDSAVSSVTDSDGLYTLRGTVHKSRRRLHSQAVCAMLNIIHSSSPVT